MKKIILFTVIMINVFLMTRFCLLVECTYGESEYNFMPTLDSESKTKVYIPINLEDAFKELKHMLPNHIFDEIKNGSEEDMVQFHFSLGLWIRNNWGLYEGSRLAKYFNNLGIKHPDNMSTIILETFWRHINLKPLQFQEKILHYVGSQRGGE